MVVGSRKGLKNLSIPVGALVTTIELLHEWHCLQDLDQICRWCRWLLCDCFFPCIRVCYVDKLLYIQTSGIIRPYTGWQYHILSILPRWNHVSYFCLLIAQLAQTFQNENMFFRCHVLWRGKKLHWFEAWVFAFAFFISFSWPHRLQHPSKLPGSCSALAPLPSVAAANDESGTMVGKGCLQWTGWDGWRMVGRMLSMYVM